MSNAEKYNFEDVIKLKKEHFKLLVLLFDKGLNKYIKQFFKNNKSVHMISFDHDWESDDEGGSYCYVNASLFDKDFNEIGSWELREELIEKMNNIGNDLRELVSGEYFRSPAVKARYESQ